MKLGLTAAEVRQVQKVRAMYVETKTNFLRRFNDAPNLNADLISLRKSTIKGFDHLIEAVLCEIASADGPISDVEAEVLDLLLGKNVGKVYYNELLRQRRLDGLSGKSDELFGTIIDVAIQLGGVEEGLDYDPQTDPVVKCIESLGVTVVAADEDMDARELSRLSTFTAIANSKATAFGNRVQNLRDGNPTGPSQQASIPQSAQAAEAVTGTPSATLEQCIGQLHALVGLPSVKAEVETLTNLARVFSLRKKNGLPVPNMSFHMVFSGNPGTGKTTVARIVGNVYGCLGLLKKGHVVEVDRSGLVGNFVGQTATKTKKVIDQARGGILFIDEAYALVKDSENDYGQEAIEVILKAMEDYRDDLVIIAAGYTDRMTTFLGSNPGLRSRFPRVVAFPDYVTDELEEIFRREVAHNGYRIARDAEAAVKDKIQNLWAKRGADFANARDVRNLFERVIANQANRVSALGSVTNDVLSTLTEADIRLASP